LSTTLFYLAIGIGLWLMGLHGLLATRQSIILVLAINIMSSGTFMVMVALATHSDPVDPVLQALVVTGLVVAVSATALALRLAASRRRRTEDDAT
jgi:multicomponent Na+:H+ antiporter subunit C